MKETLIKAQTKINLEANESACHCLQVFDCGTHYIVGLPVCSEGVKDVTLLYPLTGEEVLAMTDELHALELSKLLNDIPSLRRFIQ